MNKVFVTGACGFIGSNLIDRLLKDGYKVVGWDNYSTGRIEFLNDALNNPNFTLIEGDNLNISALSEAMIGCDVVFHLAANADVRFGLNHPSKDLNQNTYIDVKKFKFLIIILNFVKFAIIYIKRNINF